VVLPISYAESSTEVHELWRRVEAARGAGEAERELDAYWALLDHPCAHHQVTEHEVLDEIHQLLRRLGRYDEAIEAKRAAIEAGYRSEPDPEADIAECLVEAGRRAEADALYAELRRRDPDDVWLYNSAGWVYRDVDDREALRWLLDGIDVAIETGDPDQVIGQLFDFARGCWDRLGEAHPVELVARVEAFERDWVRPPIQLGSSREAIQLPPEPGRCGHCGFDPGEPPSPPRRTVSSARPLVGSSRSARPAEMALSLAWFPAGEWTAAVAEWPDLVEECPADHRAYSQYLESRLKWLASQSIVQVLSISPLTVEELIAVEGDQAGTGEGRSHLAAEVARSGRALPWPPARNEPCWCRSGRKYKKCCGPVPAAEDDGP
jgi:tetratricopeptide (TPR) repeat protein